MAAFGDRISMMGSDLLPPVCGTPRAGRGLRVEESLPVGQSQLLIALRCNVTAGHPDAPVCAVLNEMLGNSPISRLFVYVREKRSLCYSCASSYSSYYGTFLIACGLKRENRQKAEREILRQLRCLAKGEFRTEELEAAKKSLENTYRQVEDSPSALETFYYGRSLMGLHASLEERRAEFAAVTAEDVARVAGSLTADVTYFLEGTQEDGEDYDDEEN
jgi:predicted Zn-dependent peptidase